LINLAGGVFRRVFLPNLSGGCRDRPQNPFRASIHRTRHLKYPPNEPEFVSTPNFQKNHFPRQRETLRSPTSVSNVSPVAFFLSKKINPRLIVNPCRSCLEWPVEAEPCVCSKFLCLSHVRSDQIIVPLYKGAWSDRTTLLSR